MATSSITFFQVENGNCCLINVDGFIMVFDLKGQGQGGKTSYQLISPFLPEVNGIKRLDVLCISHGDQDHCGGYVDFQSEMDKGKLIIGSIWHPNFDRTKVDNKSALPPDYLALHDEILRRRKRTGEHYGHIENPLTAWDDETKAFVGLIPPEGISLHVLSPYIKDHNDTGWDVNDISLVINIQIRGLSILFPGDSGARIWQDRIIPHTLSQKDKQHWAKTDILVASHHGSYSFFGENREEVRDAFPYPENYVALNYIYPTHLVLSASTRFPTSGDQSGDLPPHYAAYKWYHQWFEDAGHISSNDEHPPEFKYTADGHIRIEHQSGSWVYNPSWILDDPSKYSSIGFSYRDGETKRNESEYG